MTGEFYLINPHAKELDQFSASGEYIGDMAGTPSGLFGQLSAVAVSENGNVYVVEREEKAVDVFGPTL